MLCFQVVLLYILLRQIGECTDYCKSEICKDRTHTMCIYEAKGPATNCKNYSSIKMNATIRNEIVSFHNQIRNTVALGNEIRNKEGKALPNATNILKLTWNDELATFAQRWANQCISAAETNQHDLCKATDTFSVGQNTISTVTNQHKTFNFTEAINSWYASVVNLSFSEINSFTGNSVVGHYTQIIWANSRYVGCGHVSFFEKNLPDYPGKELEVNRFVCNYGPSGNIVGKSIYKSGTPCSINCTCDNEYKALCQHPQAVDNLEDFIKIPKNNLNYLMHVKNISSENGNKAHAFYNYYYPDPQAIHYHDMPDNFSSEDNKKNFYNSKFLESRTRNEANKNKDLDRYLTQKLYNLLKRINSTSSLRYSDESLIEKINSLHNALNRSKIISQNQTQFNNYQITAIPTTEELQAITLKYKENLLKLVTNGKPGMPISNGQGEYREVYDYPDSKIDQETFGDTKKNIEAIDTDYSQVQIKKTNNKKFKQKHPKKKPPKISKDYSGGIYYKTTFKQPIFDNDEQKNEFIPVTSKIGNYEEILRRNNYGSNKKELNYDNYVYEEGSGPNIDKDIALNYDDDVGFRDAGEGNEKKSNQAEGKKDEKGSEVKQENEKKKLQDNEEKGKKPEQGLKNKEQKGKKEETLDDKNEKNKKEKQELKDKEENDEKEEGSIDKNEKGTTNKRDMTNEEKKDNEEERSKIEPNEEQSNEDNEHSNQQDTDTTIPLHNATNFLQEQPTTSTTTRKASTPDYNDPQNEHPQDEHPQDEHPQDEHPQEEHLENKHPNPKNEKCLNEDGPNVISNEQWYNIIKQKSFVDGNKNLYRNGDDCYCLYKIRSDATKHFSMINFIITICPILCINNIRV